MKKFILQLVLIISLLTLISCGNSSKTSNDKVLKIGYPGTQSALSGVAGIAQQKGFIDSYLKELGYSVEYIGFPSAGPGVNEALASNEIDIAIYADFPGILIESKGVNTSLIGITDNYTTSAIVVSNESDISSVKELKGKRIGFTKGTYMHKYIYEILALNGIKLDEVELINTTDGESALQGNSIDTIVTTDWSEGVLVQTKKIAKTIDSSKNHEDITAQTVIVGNKEYLNKNDDAVVAFLKALIKGKEFLIESSDEAFDILTNTGYSKEVISNLMGKDDNKFDFVSLNITDESIEKLESSKEFMLKNNIISKDFDMNEWIDKSFYEKAIK